MKVTSKIITLLCPATLLLTACSSTDDLEPLTQTGQQMETAAVGFDVYTRGSLQTRAGYVGEMDQTAIRVAGFGVYAYVTPNATWSSTGKPVFMANQPVNFAGGSWTYSPLKYWPNQADGENAGVDDLGGATGTATNSDTEGIDRVSFFAYAPYVDKSSATPYSGAADVNAVAGCEGTGIVYIPYNDATGDPQIGYKVDNTTMNGVDLMYGVAAHKYTGTNRFTGKDVQTVTAGKPFLNMTKMMVEDKIDYKFNHALTKLAVYVDAYFDEVRDGVSTPGTNDVDPNTRIVIKSVKLSTEDICTSGLLNLNNSDANYPNWSFPVAPLTPFLADYGLPIASNLLHIDKTDDKTYFAQQPLGVTKTKQPLFGYGVDGSTPASLMFVPKGAENAVAALTVAIDYLVITRDSKLKTGYNVVENNITNTIGTDALTTGKFYFNPGYAYTLNLHLGMTSVKFDAQVANWENEAPQNIDLPANVAVTSVDAGSTSITAAGKITVTSATATLSGSGGTVNLTIDDVYFTDKTTGNVLPVVDGYLPANYTGSERTIQMWYGGKASSDISQSALAESDLTVTVTAAAANIAAAGEDVSVVVSATSDTKIGDFDCADWKVEQKIDEGVYEEVTPKSTNNSTRTFVIAVPANGTGSDRNFTFKVTYVPRTALYQESAAKTQAH